jgi:hypothetical protein
LNGATTAHTPCGLEQRAVVAAPVAQRVVGQAAVEARVFGHLVAVPADQVGRLLHLADGFHAVLADFQRHRGSELEDALFDQRSRSAQQVDALPVRHGCPTRRGSARGGHGVGGVDRGACRKAAQQQLMVDRRTQLEAAAAGTRLAADRHREIATQVLPHTDQRLVESPVQRRRRVEHGGVGQSISAVVG